MLELDDAPCEIRSENLRAEYHGADRTPACDLKLQCKTSADVLAFFSPTLRAHLFDVGSVRYPQLGKMGWKVSFANSTLQLGGVKIKGATLDDFEIECTADGTEESEQVALTFKASFQPGPGQVEKLHKLLMQECTVSVTPEQHELPV